jgi:hypothetical protein
MNVISHRGYWKQPAEKNSEEAFLRSFRLGFGTETDVRDALGELVISHDPPRGGEMTLRRFLELHAETDPALPLALNVKADGLQGGIQEVLREFGTSSHFFFDMANPDALGYVKRGMPIYARHSEIEVEPVLYQEAEGVWLDAFKGEWWSARVLATHLSAGKFICIVSPELHGRPHLDAWQRLKDMAEHRDERVTICTDLPEQARDFFK